MERAASGLPKSQEHAQFISNRDLTNEGFVVSSLFDLGQQNSWCIIGSSGLAPCLLLEQIAPRSWDELPLLRTSLPRAYLRVKEALPLLPYSPPPLSN